MISQAIRQILGDTYKYELLSVMFSDDELQKYKSALQLQFSALTKNWNDELHSEWTARMFLSAKMIYSATLLINTLDYSRQKNIRVTEPYLLYYSIFNCCRALNFASPTQMLKNGELMIDSHQKTINKASDTVCRLSKEIGTATKKLLELTRDYRELFSYKFPANGLRRDEIFNQVSLDVISDRCNLLCEIAQFTSECFQASFEKNCLGKKFTLDEKILEICISYQGDTYFLIDEEDAYRVSYILRNVKRPYNIYFTMTGGMTDDFFGSWTNDDDGEEDAFNPDDRKIQIFNFP